jgi:hypothetical protein
VRIEEGEHTLSLRQIDEARANLALIERNLKFLASQLAQVPTRAYLCRMLLIATASVWTLLALLLLLR